ncbi:MAG: MCE family protein [Deltaproteobacteria bacterium]|nr:MCE family protein [Deltaproteobacteria bacterium]
MEPKVKYMLVGLFVFVLGGVMLGAVLWLAKAGYGVTYDRYYTYTTESVSGLSVNSAVKYRGVQVGRVKGIVLDPENPERVRITLDIVRATPIKEDTLAVLETQGLTGLSILNLTGGSRQSPQLTVKPGEAYPVIPSGPSLLSRLDKGLSRLLADETVPRLLANLNRLTQETRTIVDEENRAAMKEILHDLSTVTHTLSARSEAMDRSVSSAAKALENLAGLTDKLTQQVPDLLEHANQTAQTLKGMSEEVARTSTAVTAAVQDTRPSIEQFARETLPETGLLIGELRVLTANLHRLTRQLEQYPNSLIVGRPSGPLGPGE